MPEADPQRVPVPDDTRAEVTRLVDLYRRNEDHYRSSSYNETEARIQFINPFFEALGWDIANRAGYAEPYRDVVHEDSIRVSGAVKAPDYCFRIGGQRRFFLEAKKPSVSVRDDAGPAYQLRRYGWSAHLPLSVLTDFEELAVYDCRLRPKPTDAASVARINFFTFGQYLDRLDDLYSVFSKEAILRGSFDRYAADTARKRGTTEVDDEFLKEIEAWRDLLARDLALHNADLSVPDLNFAVQSTIDRLLFLRIAEDRGVEPYGRLRDLASAPDIYPRLCAFFLEADDKYNAGLFDFSKVGDALCMGLRIADKSLKDILSGLYYPQSPYEFSVLGADILGAVYEQFLGKVIRLTAGHRAVVEEKPEVRKAGGVYYTPRYIVDYIVEHTVGEAVNEAGSPDAAAKLRVLDPACGSGSFLLGAYQYLLDWHLRWYLEHDPGKLARRKRPVLVPSPAGGFCLSTAERKRILLSALFGVDLDPQAVEVAKLNLLLKCMEGETAQSADQSMKLFHERLLPNLDRNIKCGNSLIGPDYFEGRSLALVDPEELRRVRPFDWKSEFPEIMAAGGFDCVIGNPPYVFGRDWRALGIGEAFKAYFKGCYEAATYQMDMFSLFMERAIYLAGPQGWVGQIVPNVWLTNAYSAPTRRLLFARSQVLSVAAAPPDVFERIVVDTVVYAGRKGAPPAPTVAVLAVAPSGVSHLATLNSEEYSDGTRPVSLRADDADNRLLLSISGTGRPLGELAEVTRGIHSYRIGGYGQSAFGPGPQTARDVQEQPYHSDSPEPGYRPFVWGRDLTRYGPPAHTGYVRYGPWLAEPRAPRFFEGLRIYSRKILADRLVATLTDDDSVGDQQVYITKVKEPDLACEYVLAILASRLMAFYIRTYFSEGADQFPQIKVGQLKSLPIPLPAAARANHVRGLVEAMLDLHKRLADAKNPSDRDLLQRQIDATDRQIDLLVYELYGLTDDETAIVEAATQR